MNHALSIMIVYSVCRRFGVGRYYNDEMAKSLLKLEKTSSFAFSRF